MKKLFFSMLGIGALLFSTACSDESIVQDVKGDQSVQFTVELTGGSDASRAISDGLSVDELYCEVYSVDNNGVAHYLPNLDKDAVTMTETVHEGKKTMTAKVDFALVKGQNYKVVFWAQADGAYTIAENENGKLTNITVATSESKANDESKDAFTAVEEITVSGPISKTITLRRPFAQVNFGTTQQDYEDALKAGIDFSAASKVITGKLASKIAVSHAATAYNALTETSVDDGTGVTFGWAEVKTMVENEVLNVGGVEYKYIATAYMLVPGGKAESNVTDLEMEIETGLNENITLNVPYAPVQRNYRTNVLGNLLTNTADFTVIVDPIYNNPDYNGAEFTTDTDIVLNGNTVFYEGTKPVKVSGNGTLVLSNNPIYAESGSAVTLAAGADVTIDINGEVKLTGAAGGDGIEVPATAKLTLTGDGNLVTIGNAGADPENIKTIGGSGIGNAGAAVGTINITDLASLTAKGYGAHAFGIGGNAEGITISNTTIEYVSGGFVQPELKYDLSYGKSEPEGGAAIGLGNGAPEGAKVVLDGVTVKKADGGSKAAAIGGQYWADVDLTITNSTLLDIQGGNASAGIGGSRVGDTDKQTVKILIDNSTVVAKGGQYGAGIGSGYDTHCNGHEYEGVNDIQIKGNSVITATGGQYAAGIGTGYHVAFLTGSIESTVKVTATAGASREKYTIAQEIGYGVVDKTREFSGDNANITFTVGGTVIPAPIDATSQTTVKTTEELTAAIAAASAGDVIVLADGNYSGLIDVTKAVTLKAANKGAAVIDGMVHIANSNLDIKLENLSLKNTNNVTYTTDSKLYGNTNGGILGVYNVGKLEVVNCTFDIAANQYGIRAYVISDELFVSGCTFNCNEQRPIAVNSAKTTVTGCTFNNQRQYSLRLHEWEGKKQTVVFTNNVINGYLNSPVEGINFSLRSTNGNKTVIGDFTIKGNTKDLKYRYRNDVIMSDACTYNTDIENFSFVSE